MMANRNDEALRALLRQIYGMAAEGCESPMAAVRWCERIDELLHEGAASDEYAAYARDVPAATLALLTPRPEPAEAMGGEDARLRKVTEFALRRFMHDAYARANEAAQKTSGKPASVAEQFLRDAKDAERAITALSRPEPAGRVEDIEGAKMVAWWWQRLPHMQPHAADMVRECLRSLAPYLPAAHAPQEGAE